MRLLEEAMETAELKAQGHGEYDDDVKTTLRHSVRILIYPMLLKIPKKRCMYRS